MLLTASLTFSQFGNLTKPQSNTQLLTSSEHHTGEGRSWCQTLKEEFPKITNILRDTTFEIVLGAMGFTNYLTWCWCYSDQRCGSNENWAATEVKHHFLVSYSSSVIEEDRSHLAIKRKLPRLKSLANDHMQISGSSKGKAEPWLHLILLSKAIMGRDPRSASWDGVLLWLQSPRQLPVLTAFLRSPDAQLLCRVLSTAQPEGLPVWQIEGHFHPWLRGHLIHLRLLGAPHFSTESHGIAVLFYI